MSIDSILPSGMTVEDLIIIMSALSASLMAGAIWFALLHRDPGLQRAKLIAAQRDKLREGAIGPVRRKQKFQPVSLMRTVVHRLRLLKSDQTEKISLRLMQAGWRTKDAVVRYLFARLVLPFAVGGIAIFLFYGLNAYQLDSTKRLLVSAIVIIVAAYLPDVLVKNAAQKRQKQITKALPDAMDLMVICAEAGLSLDLMLMRVSQEMAQATPEIADEFSVTAIELGFLPERRKALDNLALRTNLPAIRAMVNTLLQAERYGTPLAQSLRVLSAESRNERVMKAEEKAARLPAMMTVPMIVFILPPLFVVLLGPAILSTIDALRDF